ncbi:MAG TPA: UTP--glucose-1-phosphate uridylyltransferase GalU [Emcibacteraceae bacterium]|nr:UTP--glucose-1-phosphate uridylyltransferase GalU [Emcibacteraceae bacterium]
MKPVRKAVFPVGGMGTRFLSATKSMPKEMLPVVDKPLIQYAVEEARAAGIEEIIFVTGRGKAAIENHFDHSYELEDMLAKKNKTEILDQLINLLPNEGSISYTRQQEALGLGHAIYCAKNIVGNEPFAVLLADDLVNSSTPCLKQMIDLYNEKGGNVVAIEEVPREKTSSYGILDVAGRDGKVIEVKGLVEKPDPKDAPSNFSIIGRYILQPEVFSHLEKKVIGAGGEIQLTDAMAQMLGHIPFHGLLFDGERFDCGDKTGFILANIAFAMAREDMRDGIKDYLAKNKDRL